MDNERPHCFVRNDLGRRFFAEALGTYIFVICVVGCLAQIILGSRETFLAGEAPNFFVVTVGEGIGLALGMYVASGTSGGHINPAVSFVFAILGNLTWKQLLVHWIAQYLGAFAACCSVYAVYADAHYHFIQGATDYEVKAAGSIYATASQPSATWLACLVNVMSNSALFMLVFLAVNDKRGMFGHKSHIPGLAGLLLTLIGLSFGLLGGSAINPARDISGRIFSVLLGWDFLIDNHSNKAWFWMPALIPHLGMLIGAALYYLFVGNHWPPNESAEPESNPEVPDRRSKTDFNDELEGIILVRNNTIQQKRTVFTRNVKIKKR
ncbi:aquaporin-7-like [Paramacrobiotus metropolitanus]|uniref:aquaporin-7-like n=1 Tax=Paramacrobiotus metropolitanus TaxID=2943436 RepID=UPI002445B354|nr:aquaporin-7-like [Paramacrobiotus metropolitanus]